MGSISGWGIKTPYASWKNFLAGPKNKKDLFKIPECEEKLDPGAERGSEAASTCTQITDSPTIHKCALRTYSARHYDSCCVNKYEQNRVNFILNWLYPGSQFICLVWLGTMFHGESGGPEKGPGMWGHSEGSG